MGSPVSPIVANMFMEHFEEKALISFHHSLKFWGRYVDDTMVAILYHLIEEFTIHLNSIDDRIQFTVEHQQDRCIPMLDTKISILDDGSLKFEVYRKKTHTDQYMQYDSHQTLQHKLGVVRTLTHWATTIYLGGKNSWHFVRIPQNTCNFTMQNIFYGPHLCTYILLHCKYVLNPVVY